MDKLGRYYTADTFSNLLVDKLATTNPANIIELGVGKGALLKAAISKWLLASFYATDVDNSSVRKIRREFPFVKTFHIDTIKEDLSKKIKISSGAFDIAICNPPYTKITNGHSFDKLFTHANLNECSELKLITSDIVFLAKNLQLLRDGGELGIILPDSLITGKNFLQLRRSILKRHQVKGVIQLPERVFAKTEALTHILILEKNRVDDRPISLFMSNNKGQLVDKIEINQEDLISRMDYKYHSWNKRNSKRKSNSTIGNLKVEIKRGCLPHSDVKKFIHYIHTTSIVHLNDRQIFRNTYPANEELVLSKSGDILLSRVGRNVKICQVYKGQCLLSDCVYRIRVAKKFRAKVWMALTSEEGQERLKALTHGVCAKVLSKRDLLDFPI